MTRHLLLVVAAVVFVSAGAEVGTAMEPRFVAGFQVKDMVHNSHAHKSALMFGIRFGVCIRHPSQTKGYVVSCPDEENSASLVYAQYRSQ